MPTRLAVTATVFGLSLLCGTTGAGSAQDIVKSAHIAAAPIPRLKLHDLGPRRRAADIRIALVLNYRNADELEAFIRATSDPTSPEFGHFLSPSQFDAAFAASPSDYDRLASTLARAGFRVTNGPTRSIIEAIAPTAVIERFFDTRIDAVQQGDAGEIRYANVLPARLPAALAGLVYGVTGLHNLLVAKPHGIRSGTHTTAVIGSPLQGPDAGLAPYVFANAYDYPLLHPRSRSGQTYDGSGRTVGVAIDADLLDSDLASFLSYFGIKRTGPPLLRVPVDGGSSGTSLDSTEATLDVEAISSLAPGAAVYLYLMPQLSTIDIVDTYAKVVADDKVDVLNSSFGGCELADNLAQLSDHIAEQGVSEGITFLASSGDSGAVECFGFTPNYLGVAAPASDPHFTAVGGSSLVVSASAAYTIEFAWGGSGGGISTVFGVPRYQAGIAHILENQRNVPDISLDANPGDGISYFYNGSFQGPYGGTSLSSALLSALVAEVNEVRGRRSGEINYALYNTFRRSGYASALRDITVGTNAFRTLYPGYNAGPGYDDVTGLGSPIGWSYASR